MHINSRHAPRFNAHEDNAFSPESYGILASTGVTLATVLATGKYKGKTLYQITRSGAGASDRMGMSSAETE